MNSASRSLVLIGFFGTGKSEVGAQLALRNGWRLVEIEELVEEALGLPLPWIISELGRTAFHDAESTVLETLKDPARTVIATCGPAVQRPENIALLRNLGTVVWLTATIPTLLARLNQRKEWPLLEEEPLTETVTRLLGSWEESYQQAADLTVDTSMRTPEEVADIIQHSLSIGRSD